MAVSEQGPTAEQTGGPRRTLSVADGVLIIIGVVIGAGIFKTPSLVAASSGTPTEVMLFWLVGGVISLIGALCYAELASTYPHAGGEYHYMTRAFGQTPGFLFAWARMTVIQTGSIAMLAFLIGDYASEIFRLGENSSSHYAGLVILALTAINIAGIRQGKWMQRVLIATLVLGLTFMVAVGFTLVATPAPAVPFSAAPDQGALGRAMIFVLLTYGGWNEAAYLSAEVREKRRSMVKVLLYSIVAITSIYLVINLALLASLGLQGMAGSEAVAADLMRLALGENGARSISLLIAIAAVSTMNATIITGARTNFALGRDFRLFSFLGYWKQGSNTPVNALLLQGAIALGLVALGTGTRSGFVMMVDYTAPVFWFFFLLVGLSLFVLRYREPQVFRPFRVPFYPLTPLLFCMVCSFMLYSSLTYTGRGALFGVVVLTVGLPLLWLMRLAPRLSNAGKEKEK
jgi:basic amino acid/polyamine antiporter, APA family